jgi:hypothetical protein
LNGSKSCFANKIRSSIDNRKLRISASKSELKRRSVKRVQLFLKDIIQTPNETIKEQHTDTASYQDNNHINQDSNLNETTKSSSVNFKQEYSIIQKGNQTIVSNSVFTSFESSKSLATTSLSGNAISINKINFSKFLERNTPSKKTIYVYL